MSKYTHVFCDCCGREITEKFNEPSLFVSMTIHGHNECHFCFDCSRFLLDSWWKEARRIREEKLVDIQEEGAQDDDRRAD